MELKMKGWTQMILRAMTIAALAAAVACAADDDSNGNKNYYSGGDSGQTQGDTRNVISVPSHRCRDRPTSSIAHKSHCIFASFGMILAHVREFSCQQPKYALGGLADPRDVYCWGEPARANS